MPSSPTPSGSRTKAHPATLPLPVPGSRPSSINSSRFTPTPGPLSSSPRDYFSAREGPQWTVFGQLLEDDRTPGSRGHDTPVHTVKKSRGISRSRPSHMPTIPATPNDARAVSPARSSQFFSSPPHRTQSPARQADVGSPTRPPGPLSIAESRHSIFTRTESFDVGEPHSGE